MTAVQATPSPCSIPVFKISARCTICQLPNRDKFHEDHIINNKTHAQLSQIYFPNNLVKTKVNSISKHFMYHFPKRELEKVFLTQIAVVNTGGGPPLTASERLAFSAGIQQRVDAVLTVEQMMKQLMDRANHIQEEWEKIHLGTKCTSCGRDDTSNNLVRMIAVFRELRQQADEWAKLRNPMGAINKLAEKAFVTFVEEMTTVYVAILTEKARLVRDALNKFFAGETNQAVFVARVTELLEDFGADGLATTAQDKYSTIMSEIVKEFKL